MVGRQIEIYCVQSAADLGRGIMSDSDASRIKLEKAHQQELKVRRFKSMEGAERQFCLNFNPDACCALYRS